MNIVGRAPGWYGITEGAQKAKKFFLNVET